MKNETEAYLQDCLGLDDGGQPLVRGGSLPKKSKHWRCRRKLSRHREHLVQKALKLSFETHEVQEYYPIPLLVAVLDSFLRCLCLSQSLTLTSYQFLAVLISKALSTHCPLASLMSSYSDPVINTIAASFIPPIRTLINTLDL